MPDARRLQKRQKVLADFGEFALRSDDLDAVLTQACRLVAEALGTGHAKVLEIEHESRTLFVRAGVGWDEGVVGQLRLPMAEHSSETYSIELGEPVITNDLATEDRFDLPALLKDAGVKALANVPIFLPGGKLFGLLQVDASEPRTFDDDDSQFLRTYATILGPVIDRLLKVQTLSATEARFRTIVEAARDYAIFLTDTEGRIADWLPGAEAVFGWTADEAIGRPAAMLFTPEESQAGAPQAELNAAREHGSAPDVRWHLRKDGSRVFIQGTVVALRDEAGHLRGFQKIGQDVTQRRLAEEALRESEARHSLLIGSLAQAVWETSADGVVTADSPSWRAHTGQTLEEWVGYGWLDAVHPDDRGYAERQWREAVAARGPVDAEFRLRAPEGGWRWTNARAAPVLDANDAIEKWVGMNIDIDARKRAEAALRDSEERYRNLFETIDEGFCVIELVQEDGRVVDYRLIEVNRAFEAQTGLVNATGRLRTELAPGDEDPWLETYGEVARAGEAQRFERYHEPTDRWYDVFVRRVDGANPPRVAIVFNDITLRKQAEAELRANEERQAFLLKLTDALRPISDAAVIQATTAGMVAEHLGADRAMYAEVEGELGSERGMLRGQYVRSEVAGEQVVPFPEYYTYGQFGQHTMAARYRGEPLVVNDVQTDPAYSAEERAAWAQFGVRAAIVATLPKGGRLVAEFGVHSTTERKWTDAEIALVREVAERTWAAAERARAETGLRVSEESYRTLFDTIDSGYALTDNVRDEEGRVVDLYGVDFNRSYTHHSGLPPFAGRRASEVITVQPEWLRQFEEVTRTGVPARHENYIAERDRWVSTHYSLVGALGSDRVAVVFDDITDRKRAEAALRESEERQTFLLKLSDALRPLSDPVAIKETAARVTAEHLDIGRVAYCEVRQEPEPTAVIKRDWRRRDLPTMAGRHRIADFGAFLGKELPAGRPVVVSDARTDPRLSDTERGHWASLGVVASYNVPIIKDGRVAAYLVAHDNCLHHWTDIQIAILGEVAERTWASVERAAAEAALRESEERFRLLLQNVRDYAIFTMDRDGTVTSWPAGAATVYGWSEEEILGRSVDLTFVSEDVAGETPRKERETAEREGFAPNVRWHLRRDGSRIFIDGSTQPLVSADGQIREFIKIGQDVTEARRTQQALAEGEQRLRTLMEGIPQLVWRSSDEGRWTWSSPQWQAFTGQSLGESLALGWLDAVHPDDRETTVSAWESARPHGMLDVEYRVRRALDSEYLWHHTRSLPVRDKGGRVVEWLGTTTDVQQLKELQERQAVMVAELQHRTRNLIAVVRSIAQQTMAQTGPTEAFRDEFSHRLEALARVQGLLSRSNEEPITIETLIRMELDAFGALPEVGRIEIQGPPARIRHSVVQTLALALHELAKNARKYGALASDHGRLQVRWRTYTDAKDERLALEWTETGGQPPKHNGDPRRGYGRELIERALPYSLNAKTSFEHDMAGVRCTIDMPLRRMRGRRTAA